jgi:hypothetical protein
MARAVLLTFRDNQAAEAFVKKLWAEQDPFASGEQYTEVGFLAASSAKIEWMLAQPLAACKCSGKRVSGNKFGYKKTKRFGWWVHAACNKPTKLIIRTFIENLKNGHNDILPELFPNEPADVHIMSDAEHVMEGSFQQGNVDHSDHVLKAPGESVAG